MFLRISKATVIVLLVVLLFGSQIAFAQAPVVHAVLFFSPACEHCHKVIEEVLPPLAEQYSQQLDIAGIDVQNTIGQNLYQAAVAQFQIPDDRIGIPTLIIGDVVLVGASEIPQKLPGLIEEGLAKGGVDWPNIPGLAEIITAQPETPQISGGQSLAAAAQDTGNIPAFVYTFFKDPIANSIAILVLLAMIASVIAIGYIFITGSESKLIRWHHWAIPVLAIIGLGAAIYLSIVEVTKTEAVCGPIGNCNSVQESPYAILFGILPVGILGAVGYLAILAALLFQKYGPQAGRKLMAVVIWAMAWFGILFSIYLTFLEPFVIGATCVWCITSAIVMTLIFWASTGPALDALKINDDEDVDADEDDEYREIDEILELP